MIFRAMRYNYLFFDLDGTLTKSEYGIIDSATYALEKMGISVDSPEELKKFIGPPLYVSFRDFYGMSQEDAERAVVFYRDFYVREGIYNAPLYDGIAEVLEKLQGEGYTLFVVTSKPAEFAEIVLEHNDIRKYFSAVIGPTKEKKHADKICLINEAIDRITESAEGGRRCEELRNSISEKSLMIGDRLYDIEAAVKTGIDSIGVLFGYGSRQELEEAGATYIAGSVEDIMNFL